MVAEGENGEKQKALKKIHKTMGKERKGRRGRGAGKKAGDLLKERAAKKFFKRHLKKETFKRSTGTHRHRESESDRDTQKLEQEQSFNKKYIKNPKAAAKGSQSCSALPWFCHAIIF